MKFIKKCPNNQSLERVELIEYDGKDLPKQIKVLFYTLKEVMEKYPNHHFDKYGNLVIRERLDETLPNANEYIAHLAPSFFADLGTIQHIHEECGYSIENVFIKSRL